MEHTGNPYPTHGLGPVCQILNIHRGDRLNYLVSMSTHQAGMTEYARRTFGKESPEAQQAYLLGDINTTLIHTVKGKTIQLQYCTVHPRPYSRSHTICGTRGFAQKYPVATISLEDVRSAPEQSHAQARPSSRYLAVVEIALEYIAATFRRIQIEQVNSPVRVANRTCVNRILGAVDCECLGIQHYHTFHASNT